MKVDDVMELNIDCVRDVLIEIEKSDFCELLEISDIINSLSAQYDASTITYTCNKLYEARYISANTQTIPTPPYYFIKEIVDITFDGHQFLEKVREPNLWDQIKAKLPEIGAKSFDVILSIAGQLIAQKMSNLL